MLEVIFARMASQKRALIIVDFQNDFCSPRGKGADKRGDVSRLEGTAKNIQQALSKARSLGIEIAFVQFLGDRKFQRQNLVERDRRLGKRTKCLEGSWGADFFRVEPAPRETIFQKHACFDAFSNPAFERFLKKKGISRLVLAGVYLDVCVDTLARTAFQRGFYVSVLSDCTESLFYEKKKVLDFMAHYYGAKIGRADELLSAKG